MTWSVVQADAVEFMDSLPTDSVDLVLGSPPYMDARTYQDGTLPKGAVTVRDCQEWVDWMLNVSEAAVRVSRGLVLWVVAGVQREGVYWPGCEGLMWEWWKRGNHLWCPCVWWKVDEYEGGTGIPGSGGNVPGQRWLRKDWEYVVCFKKPGGIPYDMPTNMGHEPIFSHVGGEMSNRTADGKRANERRGYNVGSDPERRRAWKNGTCKDVTARKANGERKDETYVMPKVANPGNVLPIVVKSRVGGGHMGSPLCHENEAPYPEDLAEFFVLCYSAPSTTVLDCFLGSGTTGAVSVRHGRNFLGCDLRQSQVELSRKRISQETPVLFS